MVQSHNCLPVTPITMKLHAKALHVLKMCPKDFGVKRSRSRCIDNWKWFMSHNFFRSTPNIMKLHAKTLRTFGMYPIDLGIKGQGHYALINENGLFRIIAFSLHQTSWNFTQRLHMNWWCALLIFGVQRSRSQSIDCWKRLMWHNCFLSSPIIMKLHTKASHESRMCPMDLGVKRSKSQDSRKWDLTHYCFTFTPPTATNTNSMFYPNHMSISWTQGESLCEVSWLDVKGK